MEKTENNKRKSNNRNKETEMVPENLRKVRRDIFHCEKLLIERWTEAKSEREGKGKERHVKDMHAPLFKPMFQYCKPV